MWSQVYVYSNFLYLHTYNRHSYCSWTHYLSRPACPQSDISSATYDRVESNTVLSVYGLPQTAAYKILQLLPQLIELPLIAMSTINIWQPQKNSIVFSTYIAYSDPPGCKWRDWSESLSRLLKTAVLYLMTVPTEILKRSWLRARHMWLRPSQKILSHACFGTNNRNPWRWKI